MITYEYQEYPKCLYGPKVNEAGERERIGVRNAKDEAEAKKKYDWRDKPTDFSGDGPVAEVPAVQRSSRGRRTQEPEIAAEVTE